MPGVGAGVVLQVALRETRLPTFVIDGGLAIMGVRSATAISASVSELYASHFNDDKKLLAFTDNVQDASHHAGFYNSRTWRFGLRTAMQQYSMQQEEEKSLKDFTEDWKQK